MPRSPKNRAPLTPKKSAAPTKRASTGDLSQPVLPGIPANHWWGYKTKNVEDVVDLQTTYSDMDNFARGYYTNGLTCGALRNKIALATKKNVRHTKARVIGIEGILDPSCDYSTIFADKTHPAFVVSSEIEIKDVEGAGRGICAKNDIKAGTIILVERPLVGVLDVEWDGLPWARNAAADGAALAGRIADAYVRNQEGLEEIFENHHPTMANFDRSKHEIREEDSDSDDFDSEEEDIQNLRPSKDLIAEYLAQQFKPTSLTDKEIQRLRAVAKFNALGFYTNCDQLFHTSNFRGLTGSGLFAIASGFNHSCAPNVNRYSIGDITVFVASDDVKAGEQLCISYIELELLCAERAVRAEALNRDFVCECVKCRNQVLDVEGRDEKIYMSMTCELNSELALLPPKERIETLQNYKELAEPMDPSGDVKMSSGEVILLGKDAQEMRVIIAQSYMHLKQWKKAIAAWRRCAAFSVHRCPANDESIPCFAMQTALCTLADGNKRDSLRYVSIARKAHGKAFGSEGLMVPRMARDVEKSFVSAEVKEAFVQLLAASLAPGGETEGDWNFQSFEIPGEVDL